MLVLSLLLVLVTHSVDCNLNVNGHFRGEGYNIMSDFRVVNQKCNQYSFWLVYTKK